MLQLTFSWIPQTLILIILYGTEFSRNHLEKFSGREIVTYKRSQTYSLRRAEHFEQRKGSACSPRF